MRTVVCAAAASIVLLGGCEAVGGVLGAGVGAAIRKGEDGKVSETFTQPLKRTRTATLSALKRMKFDVTEPGDERIKARTNEHPVDVKFEQVTEKTTRMTVTVGEGLKKDRATAQELVDQTKRALGELK